MENFLKKEVLELLEELDDIKTELYHNSGSQTNFKAHKQLLEENSIRIYYSYEEYEMHGLNAATEKIVSRAHKLQSSDLEEFNDQNEGIFFIEYNLFNDYYMSLLENVDFYVKQLSEITK